MGLILDSKGEIATKEVPKDETWMKYNEYMFESCWYHAKEVEMWETRGRGYAATGIVSENSKWLDRVMAGEITGDNILENLHPDKQRSTTPEFKDKR